VAILEARWQDRAACRGVDPDVFFPERGGPVAEAKAVCRSCPVIEACREAAIHEKFGIWAGQSERERRKIRAQRRRAGTLPPTTPARVPMMVGVPRSYSGAYHDESEETMNIPNDTALSWDEAVAEGLKLTSSLDAHRWRLGDLCLEVAPASATGVRTGALAVLDRFADAVGHEFRSMRDYRQTAIAWPPESRVKGATWGAHREVVSRPDRRELLLRVVAEKGSCRMIDVRGKGRKRPPTEQVVVERLERFVAELVSVAGPDTARRHLELALGRLTANSQPSAA
jgi:WhiB family redox-sensing transcriptional regulator